jgi:integral membrane protein
VNPATTRTVFRTLAFAEAASWALLLVAMFCKWILESEPFGLAEGGVPKAGMLHGIVFMLYIVATLVSAYEFKWNRKTTVLALAASIPPLFTIWFETWADRKGLLARAATPTTTP